MSIPHEKRLQKYIRQAFLHFHSHSNIKIYLAGWQLSKNCKFPVTFSRLSAALIPMLCYPHDVYWYTTVSGMLSVCYTCQYRQLSCKSVHDDLTSSTNISAKADGLHVAVSCTIDHRAKSAMSPDAMLPSAVTSRSMPVVVYVVFGDGGRTVTNFPKFGTEFLKEVPLFLEISYMSLKYSVQ